MMESLISNKSKIILTYVKGSKSYVGDQWEYPGHVSYTPKFMIDLITKAGYRYIPVIWPHTTQSWVMLELA